MKNVIEKSIVALVIVSLLFGLVVIAHIVGEITGISTVEEQLYLAKEECAEQMLVTVPEEYGVPEQALVQLTPCLGPTGHKTAEVLVIKTDKGLYVQETGKPGLFFETELTGVGFNDEGQLVPATIESFEWGQKVYLEGARYDNYYRYEMLNPRLVNASENGVLQNYDLSLMGQDIKLDKTYNYVIKSEKVRTYHPEVFSETWEEMKEFVEEVFII